MKCIGTPLLRPGQWERPRASFENVGFVLWASGRFNVWFACSVRAFGGGKNRNKGNKSMWMGVWIKEDWIVCFRQYIKRKSAFPVTVNTLFFRDTMAGSPDFGVSSKLYTWTEWLLPSLTVSLSLCLRTRAAHVHKKTAAVWIARFCWDISALVASCLGRKSTEPVVDGRARLCFYQVAVPFAGFSGVNPGCLLHSKPAVTEWR